MLVYLVWTLPFALWMLHGYVAAVPPDLEEAAAVDGAEPAAHPVSASCFRCCGRVSSRPRCSRSSRPGTSSSSPWSCCGGDQTTLPLTLARFVGVGGAGRSSVRSPPRPSSPPCPSLVVFAFLQRRLDVRTAERRGQGIARTVSINRFPCARAQPHRQLPVIRRKKELTVKRRGAFVAATAAASPPEHRRRAVPRAGRAATVPAARSR